MENLAKFGLEYRPEIQALIDSLADNGLTTGWPENLGEMVIDFWIGELSFVDLVYRHRCTEARAYCIVRHLEEKSGRKWNKPLSLEFVE